MAAQLCTCVFEGNMPLLRRLIRAGAAADAGDYDRRTALHIAAAEGNTAAVRTPGSTWASMWPKCPSGFSTQGGSYMRAGVFCFHPEGTPDAIPQEGVWFIPCAHFGDRSIFPSMGGFAVLVGAW